MKYFLIICLSLMSFISISQTVEGVWETYDESTGKLATDVKVFIDEGKLYAKIITYYDENDVKKNGVCTECNDYRKDQPILGMIFMSGLKKSGDKWKGDAVLLDPDNGKEYDGQVWLESDNKLAVRGYLGWLYETKYWVRKK